MEIIDKGDIPVERLFFYLEEYFGIGFLGKEGNEYAKWFKRIKNENGNWAITFYSFPPQKLLLFIISIFKSKLSHQKLKILLFEIEDSLALTSPYCYVEGYSSIADFFKHHEAERKHIIKNQI